MLLDRENVKRGSSHKLVTERLLRNIIIRRIDELDYAEM